MGDANTQMDDASKENIQAPIEVGIETAENCPDLDRIVEVLLNDRIQLSLAEN